MTTCILAEYHKHTITRIFGSARTGTYVLALAIFLLGILRDSLYTKALLDQPRVPLLPSEFAVLVSAVLFVVGQTLVITSTWALGITGTFLGDYFGILLDSKVEGFPFSLVRDPMYTGSTMCFFAGALWCVFFVSNLTLSVLTRLHFEGMSVPLDSLSRSTST